MTAIPLRNQPPWYPHSSRPVELPEEHAESSTRSIPAVSFGAPPDDRMSIAASEGELELFGEEDSAALLPSLSGRWASTPPVQAPAKPGGKGKSKKP